LIITVITTELIELLIHAYGISGWISNSHELLVSR